jgi:quercetin dioxygenase-like cupin family protein
MELKKTLKSWGHELLLHQGNGYAVKKIYLNAHHRTSLHYHEIKHETIMLLTGELKIYTEDGEKKVHHSLSSGDFLVIEPRVIHQVESLNENSIYFEAQTDHLDDVVRLTDTRD